MARARSSGVLLHPTSLPGGRLGPDAYAFVDWLASAGQSWWQLLPLGPPDEFGSPYTSASAFAGSAGLLADPDAPVSRSELGEFVERERFWVRDWAEFRGDDALEDQVRFQREWAALRTYAEQRGVRLIGDLPIYVARGSADHVSHPELFVDDVVAGVPPDDFSRSGQLWGNPIYDWRALRATGYRWWIERFRRAFELVDVTRVDHFRGFVAYWAVPADETSATAGSWRRGPGRALFDAVQGELGSLPLIAEDLGVITRAVDRLREELRLPGMLVLQFGLSEGMTNPHKFDMRAENRVAYTGTHDNDTSGGWWASATPSERTNLERALARAGVEEDEVHWAMIELAFAAQARIAIAPAQDVLGLGSEGRMNLPGTVGGNWGWRLEKGQLTPELAARLRAATRRSGRV